MPFRLLLCGPEASGLSEVWRRNGARVDSYFGTTIAACGPGRAYVINCNQSGEQDNRPGTFSFGGGYVQLVDRCVRYKAIEDYRKRPLIVYATSTRMNVNAMMAGDAV